MAEEKSGLSEPLKQKKNDEPELGALRERLALLERMVDKSPTLIAALDRELRFITASRRYIESFGLNMPSLAGRYLLDVFPSIQSDWLQDFRLCLNGEKVEQARKTIPLADGRSEIILRTLEPFTNSAGETTAVIVLNEIITRQVETENALLESERKYQEMVENINDVIYLISPDGVVRYVSPVISQVIGFSPSEITGHSFMEFIHPDDRGVMGMKFTRRKYAEKSPTECRIICRDGSFKLVRVSSKPIIRDGRLIEVGGVLTDISRERATELEKQLLEKQLQQARRMEAIGTLAGSVAHDLNNILSGLVSYPDMLLLQIPESDPLRKNVETIKKAGERAAVIVQDLLTLARRGLTELVVVDVNRLIVEYLGSPEARMLKRRRPEVMIEFDPQYDLPRISGSPVHLKKVIMNLVNNAAEAITAKGLVVLSTRVVSLEDEDVVNPEGKDGDYVELSVDDTGVGIPPEDVERIFEPFYSTKKLGRSGTGLGMAIVWNTVQDHNGLIVVQSKPGKGSTIRLLFPACDRIGDELMLAGEPCIDELRGNGELILLVDDVAEQLEIGSSMLKHLGYTFITASSGEEAVRRLRRKRVDLVVLDMIMDPGQDGFETYRQILEIYPGQRAVIASGYAEEERMNEAMNLGISVFVRKPYTLATFGQAVKNGLRY